MAKYIISFSNFNTNNYSIYHFQNQVFFKIYSLIYLFRMFFIQYGNQLVLIDK